MLSIDLYTMKGSIDGAESSEAHSVLRQATPPRTGKSAKKQQDTNSTQQKKGQQQPSGKAIVQASAVVSGHAEPG